MGIGDWGLGIGDWGLGVGPNPHLIYFKFVNKSKNLNYICLMEINFCQMQLI